MSKKIPLLALLLLFTFNVSSQEKKTCDSSGDDVLLDLNSITKCSIDESKNADSSNKAKNVSVVVRSRRRVVRKRDAATGLMTKDYSHKVEGLKKKDALIDNLNLDKSGGLKIIPFDFVDEIPLFKACESAPIAEQGKCFKAELANHVKKHMKYPESAYIKRIQGRVFVYFAINKDGTIGKINITSPYKGELLGKEAERIIKKLPKFKPGKHEGAEVTVKYAIPLTFRIPGVKPSNIKKAAKIQVVNKAYTFEQVGTIPQFKSCKSSNGDALACFNTELIKHIQENFAYPSSAVDDNISGTVNVNFIINKNGDIVNIEAKGPQNGKILENAAKNLVEKLSSFQPGLLNGKPVDVKYSFPVNFELD